MTPPGCTAASAIRGLPITRVAVRSGSFTSLAWSRLTVIGSRRVLSATGSAARAVFVCVTAAKATARPPSPANSNGRQPRPTHPVIELSARYNRQPDTRPQGTKSDRVDSKMVNEVQSQGLTPRLGLGRTCRLIEALTLIF